MRRLILLAGVVLAVGVFLPGSALPAAGGSDVPVKGKQSGYCTTDWNISLTRCVTTGPVSHFGLSSMEEVSTGADQVGPDTYRWTSHWKSTAASGDQMFGTATGTVRFDGDGVHATSVGIYTSSGGTGRLADATLKVEATVRFTVLEFDWVTLTSTQYAEVTIVGTLSH